MSISEERVSMKLLFKDLLGLERVKELMASLATEKVINISNINSSYKEILGGLVFNESKKTILYITATDYIAQKKAASLEKILGNSVGYFPMESIHDYFADVHSREINDQRLKVLGRILLEEKMLLVVSIEALLKKLMPKEEFSELFFTLRLEEEQDQNQLMAKLFDLGYENVSQVEAKGQYAHRGGILDIFPTISEVPYRIEFFGDEIESIRIFDPETQLSLEGTKEVRISPGREIVLTDEKRKVALKKIKKIYGEDQGYAPLIERMEEEKGTHDEALFPFVKGDNSLIEYLKNGICIWDEPPRTRESLGVFYEKLHRDFETLSQEYFMFPEERNKFYAFGGIEKALDQWIQIKAHVFSARGKKGISLDMRSKDVDSFVGNIGLFTQYIKGALEKNYIINIRGKSEESIKKIRDLLEGEEIHRYTSERLSGIQIELGEISQGFEIPKEQFLCINQTEILKENLRERRKHRKKGRKIDSFTQLNKGDYVVHDTHGIGIYRGIEQLRIDEIIKDLMVIEYANDAKFYCPVDQMDAIQVYIGTGEKKPRINQLGTSDWSRSKTKVKAAVEDMADELIALYAKRKNLKGYAFGPDSSWQTEFEESFPHIETLDQLQVVEEIKGDMESTQPMDRLLCGDVGYGKTEVALRAAFKAVMEGKQVALLVPTTILAQQHYQTALERFKKYPVEIGLLSRFKTKKQQEQTLKDLTKGKLDMVIGTHRLLSKDVVFHNLGLLIVDEEQRFGVRHKERIKQLKEDVDVLTLSATPIPRTLHMSMVGVRDMSVIDEPPAGRRPVQTYVLESNPSIIKDAIEREIKRGGQVYFVHNRIQDIFEVGRKIQKLVPEARVVVAHGRMTGGELEDIMIDFLEHEYDILVTTTIIESGLDIKNANTLIVDNGDHMGLSQLYQLRGRVGRSEVQGYAYITHPPRILSEIAQKRLQAIKDFTAFGSGFKVALRDLEIRGAGNILGAEQSGNLSTIGYELYCRILEDAVRSRIGKTQTSINKELNINLDVSSYIPETYISNEELKYDIYKKLSYVKNQKDYDELEDELLDRFGDIPKGVYNLMALAMIKDLGRSLGVTELRERGAWVYLTFDNQCEMPVPSIEILNELFKAYALKLNAGKGDMIRWKIQINHDNDQKFLKELYNFLEKVQSNKN